LLTLRGIAMSTVAYITAITIGLFSVSMLSSNAASSPISMELPAHIKQIEAEVTNPLVVLEGAKQLTQHELVELLAAVGFEGKSLKTAWSVVMRESRGRPVAHNKNANTGDNSYGLFQINMIGSLGVDRLAKFQDKIGITKVTDLFDPVKNAKAAYYMTAGGKDWGSWGLGPNAYDGDSIEPAVTKWYTQFPTKSKS
jgi:hypothetical protein